MQFEELRIAVIGLGYVGLPLAIEFGKKRKVIGYDIDEQRIRELSDGVDRTLEVSKEEINQANKILFSSDENLLQEANCFIITVPTPIDNHKKPNLGPLINATKTVGSFLSKGDIVIYESTVYPGATEEDCVPVLESISKLKFNVDFFCGYSPERINPGDKIHRLTSIKKVTSGSTPKVALLVDELYNDIISAGTYMAESIKVAEAAKVIENTQRDINIALINELAMLFKKMEIDTESVIKAASSKWNFLPFKPGLVGGHCIGVDPYYLTYKAEEIGYHPQMILAGRRINDGMGSYVAFELIKEMIRRGVNVNSAKVLIMGITFKENCPDTRNSKVVDIFNHLRSVSISVDIFDPWVDKNLTEKIYGATFKESLEEKFYDAVIIAVAHTEFEKLGASFIRGLCKDDGIIYDLKCIFSPNFSDLRL